MTPPVSVVIPVWDSYVRWLDEAVRSVVEQDAGAEVIVVNNASTAPVPEFPGTTVVRSPTRVSTGAARNLGLEAVTAPLVVFLDADDMMLPGSLAALIAGIDTHPDVVAFVLGIVEGDTGKRHRSPRPLARALARFPAVFAFATSVWSLLPTQGATIMRTSDVLAAGGYADRSQGEDWVLAASLAWRGRVRFAPTTALVYRWREDSPGRVSSSRTLAAGARNVRYRLRSHAGVPHTEIALLAAGQWMAIAFVRPLFRFLRGPALRAAAARPRLPHRDHPRG